MGAGARHPIPRDPARRPGDGEVQGQARAESKRVSQGSTELRRTRPFCSKFIRLISSPNHADGVREGLQDINELKEVYKEKIQHLKKEASIHIPSTPLDDASIPPSTTSSPASSSSPFPPPPPAPQIPTAEGKHPPSGTSTSSGIRPLSSYLDLSRARALDSSDLEAAWRLCHASNPHSLCAVIPVSVYAVLQATARKFPLFILPLPKEGQAGAEIHILQWTFPAPDVATVIFTHLAEYKLRGEYSEPHTTLTHHLDLAADKGLVLLQGQVVKGRGVSVDEAKWLVMCLQKFYGVSGEKSERRRLLEMFGKGDPAFRVEDLLEEAEKPV